ncbi:uncharacterized protein LAESUDRAFT_761549 [Laetiporus sulphureus 93-53]|uniref:Aminoglycoside phosphotransferase domain-containing protein n=1 Tax=Laetiporus sulphureus 93-53 TaxID=1314785 RepID=A0A165D1J8_9APHY|nr:uncharacterized protein LAESUDRAFT_761549 [Laetiporus sulphureus 93-53]KZT03963.1 hypothetical protein LAESUDRAFT_761549 [Laetiporus sulphureus 93-53]
MNSSLASQISQLRKPKWADLSSLLQVATAALGKTGCESITLLGCGSYNYVYRIAFDDGSDVAASIPNADEEDFVPATKRSEIATIRFVSESGLYPHISVPKVHASDLTFANPVGAPYILMDVVKGVTLNDAISHDKELRGLDALGAEDQLRVVNVMAKIQASLSQPVPFDRLGSLVDSTTKGFVVAEGISLTGDVLGGPWKSISDMWYWLLEREVVRAMNEWSTLEKDELPDSFGQYTPQKFGRLLQTLSALIPYFVPPPLYLTLVLHHPDLALRNIVVDPHDYSKVNGIIDWGGAQILPLMLTAHYPHDLLTEGDDPCERPGHPDEGWNTVPHDWTSLGDTTAWAEEFRGEGDRVDMTTRAAAMVKRYYLRQHFGACFARALHEVHGDTDLLRATVFTDAPYYLKFHEVLTGGYIAWFRHEEWIMETFARLHVAGHIPGRLILGPNVYTASVENVVCDLSFVESSEQGQRQENEEKTDYDE